MACTNIKQFETAMRSVGYKGDLLRRDFPYSSFDGSSGVVPLAGFAQSPQSYRNACIAVLEGDGPSSEIYVEQYRALGAPLVFQVVDSETRRWRMNAASAPTLLETFPSSQIRSAFDRHKDHWNPDTVFRAKAMRFAPVPAQLDFLDAGLLPLLAGEFQDKLDRLIKDVAATTARSYARHTGKELEPRVLFRLLFRLIAGKILRDRNAPGDWSTDSPVEILSAVENWYHQSSDSLHSLGRISSNVITDAWNAMSAGPSFQNLSVDDLAFVYENTFITTEARKQFGTHSTPSSVAEYLVGKLPFEEIPEEQRRVFEPCAGHGVFLIAAMRRMAELLPLNITPQRRHNYLIDRISGLEIEEFACEVSRLSLMLADYPNSNGWRVLQGDVFSSPAFSEELGRASIVLSNPPFEDFESSDQHRTGDRNIHKPAELVRRIMDRPPALLGLVLPKIAITGRGYRDIRSQLGAKYGTCELVALPDHIFRHSDAETVLVLASGLGQGKQLRAVSREFSKAEWNAFVRGAPEPPAREEVQRKTPEYADVHIWIPKLQSVWSYLSGYPTLGQWVEFARGIHFISAEAVQKGGLEAKSTEPRRGFKPGYDSVAGGGLLQFALQAQKLYFNMDPSVHYDRMYARPWHQPKVVCNAACLSRGPWRLAGAFDEAGMVFTKSFFAMWSKKPEVSLSCVAAIVNSPVANAFTYAHDSSKRHLHINTLKGVPVPAAQALMAEGVGDLADQVQKLVRYAEAPLSENSAEIRRTLLELDAALLKAYDLPPRLERELLGLFEGHSRPVPHVVFDRYYPDGMKAAIPLHELISDAFTNSTADQLLKRIQPISDKEISHMLARVTG